MQLTSRSEVVAAAREWLGTPFHHAARAKGIGVDCAGLLVGVSRELRLVAPDFDVPPYTPTPDGHSMLEWCDTYMTRLSRSAMQLGDVIVLITDEYPQHLGLLGDYRHGGLSIIHATNSRSVVPNRVIETRLMFSRNQRFVAAYALPGIE